MTAAKTPGAASPVPAELPGPAMFSVGVARAPITPPTGTPLAGFFHLRTGTYTRDELYARAMVIRRDGQAIALVSLDLICVDAHFVDKAKAMIQAECGLTPCQVMISATHTHGGPEVRQVGNKVPRNEAWLKELPRRIADVVKSACDASVPCTLHSGAAPVDGYVFNRLYRMADGNEVMGRNKATSPILGPAGPVDATLLTLSAVDEAGRLRGVIINLGMHPVTVTGGQADYFSGDWPGAMCTQLAKIYGDDMVALFLQGACGDTNHQPYEPTHLPTSGSGRCELLGRGLAGAAMTALERAEPVTDGTIIARVDTIDIPYYTRTPEILAQVESVRQKASRTAADDYFIYAVESWPFDNQVSRVPLQGLRVGPVAMAAIPAQVFTQIGLNIKAWSPATQTMIIELANCRVTSYIPTADQVQRGAYGSNPIISRWLSVDAGRRIADAYLVMFQQFWNIALPPDSPDSPDSPDTPGTLHTSDTAQAANTATA